MSATLTRTVGEVTITVREATALDGMRRQILRGNAIQAADTDEALAIMRLIAFPDLVCCLVESSGLPEPLTFEAFCDLPNNVVDEWNAAVYTLNPQFLGIAPDPKKALKPGAGSGNLQKKKHRATSQKPSSSTSPS